MRSRFAPALSLLLLVAVATTTHAAPEGTMTWGVHITLASRWLDPAETEGIITPFMVLYGLHDALVKPMPAGINTPSLAESFAQSKDGLTYDFVIRKGVKFHNGDPVTSADVKFSFERYRGAGVKLLKDRVREIQTPDPGRVRFVLKEPWPDFMTFYGTSATGAGWIVPKAYVEKVGDDGFKKAPIGAGPYKFVSFNPGVELVMEAWDGYWRKAPNVKRLVYRSMPEETTRAAALKKGEIDIAYLLTGPVAADIQRSPGFKLVAPRESQGTFWLDLPDQWDPKSPWHDKRVRQAASLALDRQALNAAETLGFSKPTGSLIPRALEYSKFFEPDPYDPPRAKKLLADAGFPSGVDITLHGPQGRYVRDKEVAEAVTGQLNKAGIKTTLKTYEFVNYLNNMVYVHKAGPVWLIGWGTPTLDAETIYGPLFKAPGIFVNWQNDDFIKMTDEAQSIMDEKKRLEQYHRINKLWVEEMPAVPLYQQVDLYGVNKRLNWKARSDEVLNAFTMSLKDGK